jgi:hypothetical protein
MSFLSPALNGVSLNIQIIRKPDAGIPTQNKVIVVNLTDTV